MQQDHRPLSRIFSLYSIFPKLPTTWPPLAPLGRLMPLQKMTKLSPTNVKRAHPSPLLLIEPTTPPSLAAVSITTKAAVVPTTAVAAVISLAILSSTTQNSYSNNNIKETSLIGCIIRRLHLCCRVRPPPRRVFWI